MFPAGKKEHEGILSELEKRKKSPDTYILYDPIYPNNGGNPIQEHDEEYIKNLSVQEKEEKETFFYYFSTNEMLLLLKENRIEKGKTYGKTVVRNRYFFHMVLLILYTAIFVTATFVAMKRNASQVISVFMIISLLASTALVYEGLRFPAMQKIKQISNRELADHAKYFASCRFIENKSLKTVFWRNLFLRSVAHVIGLVAITAAIIYIFVPNLFEKVLSLF